MKFKFVIVVLFSIVVNGDILLGKSVQNTLVNCVFVEQTGFPAIETSPLTFPEVEKILNGQFDQLSLSKVGFADLHKLIIEDRKIDLLIWPYGSAINEKVFEDILIFLQKGGNLIVTGGRPFSSEVEETSEEYQLRQITNRFTKQLNIFDAQIVPAGNIQNFIRNPEFDFLPDIKELRPQSACSLLTFTGTDKSTGNLWGDLCSRFSTIISAADSTGTPAIPLISCFDHYSSDFTGGRWVFFTFTPQAGYWQTKEGQLLLKNYIIYASQKPFKADIVPGYAFYNPGELADFDIQFKSFAYADRKFHIDVNVFNGDKCVEKYKDVEISAKDTLIRLRLKQAVNEGLYKITFTLKDKNRVIEKRIGGFICGDIKKLNSGIPFSTNTSFLTRGGSSYPVVGMTYMAAEKHRYFLKFPNPVIWDREMKEMKESGVNMLRTGVWQWYPYELFMDTKGAPNEKTLRSLDAWLYTAKKYDLPVQYCLFPFQPQVIGCKAPYTDEQAFEVQQKYLTVLVKRYKNDPDIIWDLINEPTYGLDAQLWSGNIPTGSRSETKLWNEWLKAKYGDELSHLSGMLNNSSGSLRDGNSVKLPSGSDFEKGNIYNARQKPLIAYDYNLFAQYAYNSWAAKVRKIFRDEGSTQLITTGQDEGGITNRVQAQFYAETSDFTTQHSWWQDEDLLWDNLMAKTQNKPLLVQETNLMRYTDLRGNGRRTEQDYAKMLERKICIGFGAEGAGVIPWVWDANTALNENESSIGLNRCDGTASPEKAMYRKFAKFVNRNAKYFTIAKEPEILLVIPFTLQFSNYQSLALTATKNAVRSMHYYARFKFNVASEYHLNRVTFIPKLVVLPSVQVLSDTAWEKICKWVSGGTTLLITGPIDRDPHFESVKRLAELGVESRTEPLLQLNSFLTIGNERYQLNYYNTSAMQSIDQMVWKEDHGKIKEVTLGKGKILISEYPVELNTNLNTIAELYKYAAKEGHITSEFVTDCSNPGILIRPIDYEKARMYLLESETDTDEVFTISDKLVNKDYSVRLEAGRAKLLLISKEDGKVLDQY